jgi:hypothetical protein
VINLSEIIGELSQPGVREWSSIMIAWRQERPINKQEVIGLLRSGVPVPSYAAEFLADVLDSKYKFKRGNKPWYPRGNLRHRPSMVVHWVRDYEGWVVDPSTLPDDTHEDFRQPIEQYHRRVIRKRGKDKDKLSPNKAAVKLTAELLGLSERRVRSKITEFNKIIKGFAKHVGCTIEEARDYLLH